MRMLFVSNYYPPHALGGYEQWCQEVGQALRGRGHQVAVLTGRAPEANGAGDPDHVHRLLHLEVEGGLGETVTRLLWSRTRLEAANLAAVDRLIDDFDPHVALLWGMWNVPRSVPARIEERLPGRVAYYLCDYWLTLPNAYIQRWQEGSRHAALDRAKGLLGRFFLARLAREKPPALALAHPICVSQGLRRLLLEAGVPIEHARVIHGGTGVADFAAAATPPDTDPAHPLRLVYLGRLVADKGVHTALEALHLARKEAPRPLHLDIYGGGDPDYAAGLRARVAALGLEENVAFRGKVARETVPGLLGGYDALLFPSEWQEPFARTVLEAMAAGLAVVGTTTGGTGEILVEGETGLTFPAGDAEALARQVARLAADPELLARLAHDGQRRVMACHTLETMVGAIEDTLHEICRETGEQL